MQMTISINPDDWKKVLAEVVGTFFFVFIAIGAVPVSGNDALLVALASGLAYGVAVTAFGFISGGHFNPAVTIAMAVARKINWVLGLFYIVAQVAGGVAACLVISIYTPAAFRTVGHLATPQINTQYIDGNQSTLLEGVLTFLLVLVFFATLVDIRAPKVAGFGVGLTVVANMIGGGGGLLTGGIMNPARAIAPAIVSGFWQDDQLVYWIGPIIGAVVAALLYYYVFMTKPGASYTTVPAITDKALDPPMSEPNVSADLTSGHREEATQF